MRVIFLLLAGGGKAHDSDELTQRQTWACNKSPETEVIWLRANPDLGFHMESNTLSVPCKNDFSSILEKTILGLKWIAQNRDFDLVVRSNTSTYFEINKLLANWSSLNLDMVGGTFETSRKDFDGFPRGMRYLNGSGLYLGKNAVRHLTKLDHRDYFGIPDDVAIHRHLELNKLHFYRVSRNNLDLHHVFVPKFQVRVKSWSNDDLTVLRMRLVHEYFQSTTWIQRLQSWVRVELTEISHSVITFRSIMNFLRRQINQIRKI